MLSKLESYLHKYDELSKKLSDPEIISDRDAYLALNKEFSEIQEYCDIYNKPFLAYDKYLNILEFPKILC